MMPRRLVHLLLCAVFWPGIARSASPLRYHSNDEIITWMKSLSRGSDGFASYQSPGRSAKGREIGVISIGIPQGSEKNAKPAIIVNAAHHGDEKISTAAALHLIETLMSSRRSSRTGIEADDQIWAAALERYTFHVQPVVNPDGYESSTREDSQGRDLNRDYAWPARSEALSFKAPETRAVRDFIAGLGSVGGAIALHSGTEGVLWPWCHTKKAPDDAPLLTRLAWRTARAMNTSARQSWHDYPSAGEFTDFVYWRQKAPALTIEVDRR
ncbi:MAG: hypothetical protein RIQ81_2208, partial [Pseudomonadota bacterium]